MASERADAPVSAAPHPGGDGFDALAEAASALRRLNRAVAGRAAPDAELRTVAAQATALAERLETAAPRSKHEAMAAALGIEEGLIAPAAAEVGAALEFDPLGAGGGRLHPASVGFHLVRDTETSVVATTSVDGMFQGPPDRVHGGVVALLFDEVMSAVNRAMGRRAFTVRLTLNLRAAAPVDTEITIRAWLDHADGRKITIRAEGRSADGLFADADGLFIAWAEPAP